MEKTKVCRKCGKEFPATKEYFHKRKNSKDGFRNECKECIKKYNQCRGYNQYHDPDYKKRYREKNRQKLIEYDRQYNSQHKEETAKQVREWRKKIN